MADSAKVVKNQVKAPPAQVKAPPAEEIKVPSQKVPTAQETKSTIAKPIEAAAKLPPSSKPEQQT